MNHIVKFIPKYFAEAVSGLKNFTIRKNDRNYKVGDTITACEWNGSGYTKREAMFLITYVLSDYPEGLKEGYCILGILPCSLLKNKSEVKECQEI